MVVNPSLELNNREHFNGLNENFDINEVQVLKNGEIAVLGKYYCLQMIFMYEKDNYKKEKLSLDSHPYINICTCFIQLSNGDYVAGYINGTIVISDGFSGKTKVIILKKDDDDEDDYDEFDIFDKESVLALIELPNGYLVSSYTDNSVVIRDISQNEPKLINMFSLKAHSFILLPNKDLACFSNHSITFLTLQNELGFWFRKKISVNKVLSWIQSPFLLSNNDAS